MHNHEKEVTVTLTVVSLVVSVQVGNIGGREFAESLAPDVQKLLVSE